MSRIGAIRATVCVVVFAATVFARGDARALARDLFAGNELQRIDLLLPAQQWETLRQRYEDDDYYRATLRWNGITIENAGIRSRGLGSRSGLKPGLRVDFGRFVPNQTFLGLRSLVLDNLTQDPSGIVESVAMRFYQRMGLAAPREAHAELYVNGDYAGLYALVESIDEDFIRRVFGGTGYVFEYEYESEWFFTRPADGIEAYRSLFDPVTHKRDDVTQLYSPLKDMVGVINESPDSDFRSALSPYLDLPLFMRHVAAQNFLGQWDGILGYAGANNFYLYRPDDSVRFQFILWDEDNAFHALDYPVLEGHERNILMRRAMQVAELRAAYFDALLAAAASATVVADEDGVGWLEHEIRRQRRLVAAALQADVFKPFPDAAVDRAADTLVEFARWRPAFVRCQVRRLTDPARATAACP